MFLLDNNLSPRLCRRLEPMFPGNQHVENVGLDNSPDSEVWKYAKANQLSILTKDSDFNHFVLAFGRLVLPALKDPGSIFVLSP